MSSPSPGGGRWSCPARASSGQWAPPFGANLARRGGPVSCTACRAARAGRRDCGDICVSAALPSAPAGVIHTDGPGSRCGQASTAGECGISHGSADGGPMPRTSGCRWPSRRRWPAMHPTAWRRSVRSATRPEYVSAHLPGAWRPSSRFWPAGGDGPQAGPFALFDMGGGRQLERPPAAACSPARSDSSADAGRVSRSMPGEGLACTQARAPSSATVPASVAQNWVSVFPAVLDGDPVA